MRFRQIDFRSERGTALIDSMVGVIILAIAGSAVALTVAGIANVSAVIATDSARQSYSSSEANALAANPTAIGTTPESTEVTIKGEAVTVTRLRVEEADGSAVIRLAVPRKENVDCSGIAIVAPSAATRTNCLITEITVAAPSIESPDHTPVAVAEAAAGVGMSTSAGVTVPEWVDATPTELGAFILGSEYQFVVGIEPGAADGQIVMKRGAEIITVIDFDANATDTWFYGTLPSDISGVPVTIEHRGGSARIHQLLVYEVTQ